MKITKVSFIVFLFLILLPVQNLFAFGANGHRIVAEVAKGHLSSDAKKAVKKILKGQTLDRAATWPDFIRSESEWDSAKPWHFITIDNDTTVDAVVKYSEEQKGVNNVVEAIDFFSKLLRGGALQEKEFKDFLKTQNKKQKNGIELKLYQDSVKATALSFLVHFVGDVHQPLHVGRAEDYGGNSVKVLWFDEDSNLHSVWDEGLIESEKLSYTEMAAFLNQDAKGVKKKMLKTSRKEWARESVELRHKAYLGITDFNSGKPNLSYDYAHDFSPALQKRMLLGGLRLANLLNDIFK